MTPRTPSHQTGRVRRWTACAALTLAATAHAAPADVPSVRLLDVTGDGLLDRLELAADGGLTVAVNLGGRLFDPIAQALPSTPVADILVGDLDDDGRTDLYLVSPAHNLALTGDGTGRFVDATERLGLADGGAGVRAQRLDLDGDGYADLLLRNASRDVVFWKVPGVGFERSADTPEAPSDDGAPTTPGAPGVPGKPGGPNGSGAGTGTGTGSVDHGAGSPGADGGAGPLAPPSDLPPGVQPLVPPGQAPTLGSGGPGTLTSDPRVTGARGDVGHAGPAPTPILPPTLAAILDAKYVNDDAGEVDGADIADGVLTGADVSTTSGDVTHLGGMLGVGTDQPTERLHVAGSVFVDTPLGLTASDPGPFRVGSGGDVVGIDSNEIQAYQAGAPANLYIQDEGGVVYISKFNDVSLSRAGVGNVAIGLTVPQARLHVNGQVRLDAIGYGFRQLGAGVELGTYVTAAGGWLGTKTAHALHFFTGDSSPLMTLTTGGNLGVGTTSPQTRLHVNGTARVGVLEITGGADIVESFDSSEALEPGTVVVIDAARPGELIASVAAYDRKVAGVVSGANGVQPGIELGQDGVLDGDVPVAMTGRVWVKASAENGPIQPGDRLTTAGLAGHAMRATDADRWDGAVIGKAMSALDDGTGLVLVLVNLQ